MNLSPNTFGQSPAAMYLSVLLNERGTPALARKVSKKITNHRKVLNELYEAHLEGHITVGTLGAMLNLISEANHRDGVAPIAAIDPFIAHIVLNVLEADVKTLKRRVAVAAIEQRGAGRTVPQGASVPRSTALAVPGEKNVETVRQRSRAYLARKGKVNTLY